MTLFVVFLFWSLFNLSSIIFLSRQIPYLGFFPYKETLPSYGLPHFLSSLANFDGLHYLGIAQNGYQQYQQAFFPLYPILINLLTRATDNALISGLLISNLSFLASLFVLDKFLNLLKIKTKPWLYLFFLFFPTSFYFSAVYTESLFWFLFLLTLYLFFKKNYLKAIIPAFLVALTRFTGLFVAIPIFTYLFVNKPKHKSAYLPLFAPFLGLATYCFYLLKTTGDLFYFFHALPSFNTGRQTNLITPPQVIYRYLKIFILADHNFQYWIAVLEFVVFIFFCLILFLDLKKLLKNWQQNLALLGLNLFSWAHLMLSSFTVTLTSLPRYVLPSLSVFIYLSQLKNKSLKIFILFIFIALHFLLIGYFSQGYFVS